MPVDILKGELALLSARFESTAEVQGEVGIVVTV